MLDYKYKISVVIPVYNCEKFIEDCVSNLLKQTLSSKDFQIVLVNDGSRDKSSELCHKLESENQNIICFDKENGGVSSARNKGIELSQGKYILFLDADDSISSNCLEAVFNFFELHYDETDLVTYSIDYLDEKGVISTHKRFQILNHTDIYSIIDEPNTLQTTMNICVKNLSQDERILFDESLTLGEDQWFIFSWVLRKQTIGFVREATYTYFKHSGSASTVFNNPYYCFDEYMSFMHKILDAGRDKDGKAHPIAQALVVYNIDWRITSDLLVSHADENEEQKQLEEIREILNEVDNEIICNSIYVDPYHIETIMRLKKETCSIAVNRSYLTAYEGNSLWFAQPHVIVFDTIKIIDNKLKIIGYIKNGVISYKDFKLFWRDNKNILHEIEMCNSAYSFYISKSQTNLFGGFDITVDIEEGNSICFLMNINGKIVSPQSYFGFKCILNKTKTDVACCGYAVSYGVDTKTFTVEPGTVATLAQNRALADATVKKESRNAFLYRKLNQHFGSKKNIWLYSDRDDIIDNAYYQFIHDFEKKDGIERYYISDIKDKSKYFTTAQKKNVVEFKSLKHKLLFLDCKKLLTSFNSISLISPFDALPLRWYSDILQCEIIYLQHGILHARLPLLYSKERACVDKVVISSEFESKNFKEIYNFNQEDLIMSGMPRFDSIDTDKKAKRKILFSPSWRKNLIGEYENNTRELYPDRFKSSPFFKSINEFLNSDKLAEILEKYDLTLDFKNHPIFRDYDKYFQVDNPRINVTQDKSEFQDYLAMITDYSSIVFDFVYLDRPVLYFLPDYDQFKAGITHGYNKLDLPIEEGFGEMTSTADGLCVSLEKLAANDFVPDKVYFDRMKNFFVSREKNHAQTLYDSLISKK